MIFKALVRQKRGQVVEVPPFTAHDIREAADVIRDLYDLRSERPHNGFTIKEV